MNLDGLQSSLRFPNNSVQNPAHARIMILSSPHNPAGRVWTREELCTLGNIVLANNLIVVSDEIHCELMLNGSVHTPFASISPELEQNSIVSMASSKTFNLAGLATSFIRQIYNPSATT
jgi:cystathionine beta-lyase